MIDSPPQASEAAVLRTAIARWTYDLRELDRKRAAIVERVEAAERLLSLIEVETAENVVGPRPAKGQVSLFEHIHGGDLDPDAGWTETVQTILRTAPVGITYPEMRAKIEQTPGLAERFRRSDKGYYNAISRLQGRGDLIKHKGRLFSPTAYADFQSAVSEGRAEDEPVIAGGHSPMGEAILDIVAANAKGGILGKDVITKLREDPEFAATLTPHQTGAYNVIARLVKRRQILRREDGLCFPGIKFPARDPNSKWIRGQGGVPAM